MGLGLLRYGLGVRLSPGALAPVFSRARGFIFEAYRVDRFYQRLVIGPVTRLAQSAFSFDGRVIDGLVNRTGLAGLWASRAKGWVDQTLVDGAVNATASTVGKAGAWLRLLQTGLVQNYILIAAVSTVALFLILRGV
jgi:NADH:ubiquinone oxidoreductase subunit 5 (subunit L)/multisubunit Na+/H+ antiporter MnhA subunit